MDLGTIWASVGLKTAPLEAGVIKAKGMMTGLDASLSTGKLKGAETGLASLGTKLKNLAGLGGGASSALGGVGASIGTLGEIGIAVGAVVGLGAALFSCAKEAAEVQKVTAQTEAVIASTGGVANVTAAHVEQLGGKLRDLSGIDDEVIKTGANILLTFRGIQNQTGKNNDIFDQATAATLDLSVAMGRDMSKSAIMVGKALQDPVRGLTAMRRVGVQFTASQEEMIKSMVATGNTIGAQKIILAELNAEFGKSAEAYGRTLPGQIGKLKSAFGDLKESIGKQALAPAIAGVEQLTMAFKGLEQAQKLSTGNMIKSLTGVKTEAPGLFDGIWSGIQKIRGVWKEAFPTDIKPPIINKSGFLDFGGIIEGLTGKFSNLRSMMDSTFAQMGESSKDLADTLGTLGLKGVMDVQMKDMLDSLADSQPRVRDEGMKMVNLLVDTLGRSNQGIKDNASKIGDDIAMGVEQARALGPVTDKKMAEIVLSVIKASGPVDAAGQVMLDNLQAIINGTPITITPTVDPKSVDTVFGEVLDTFENFITGKPITAKVDVETAQASQNVTGLKANMEAIQDKGVTASTETAQASQNVTGLRNNIAGLQNKTITITAITQTQVNPTFAYPEDAGTYMAEKMQEGAGKVAPKMAMTAGIDPASAALTSTFGSFIAEMNAAPILEVEQAVNALTTADWGLINAQQAGDRAFNTRQKQLEKQALEAEINGNKDEAERVRGAAAAEAKVHDLDMVNRELNATNKTNEESIGIWRNANAAYDAGTAGLTKYTNAIKTHEGYTASLNRQLDKLDAQTAKYNKQIEKLDESTKPYEKQITALDKQTKAYEKQIRDLGDTTKDYERQNRDLDDALKVLDKSLQDSETRASDYQKTLDKFSSMKFTGEGAAADLSFAQDEESKKLQLEIMKAEDAHNYALAAKLTLQKDALDRKKEEAALQTEITYDPQKRELEQLLDPLHGQEATSAEIVKQITAAQAGLDKEKAIQETLKLQQDGIKARQEAIALLERNIADTVERIQLAERNISDQQDAIRAKIQLIVDKEELLRAKVEIIEDKQESIRAKIAAQDKAVAKLNKEYDKAKAKVDAFKEQIDKLASFFVSKYGKMKDAVTGLNNAIGGGGTIPHYQTGTSYVPATGLAVVHEGEQIIPKLRPMQMHMTSDTQVTIPLYLDGKVLAKTVTKIQGGNASAYSASGGSY